MGDAGLVWARSRDGVVELEHMPSRRVEAMADCTGAGTHDDEEADHLMPSSAWG